MLTKANGHGEGFIVKDSLVSTGRHDFEKSYLVHLIEFKAKRGLLSRLRLRKYFMRFCRPSTLGHPSNAGKDGTTISIPD